MEKGRDAAQGGIPPETPPAPQPPEAPPVTQQPSEPSEKESRHHPRPQRRGPRISPLVAGVLVILLGLANIVVEILRKTLSVNDVLTGLQVLVIGVACLFFVPRPREEKKGLPKLVIVILCVVIVVGLAFVKHIPGIPTDDTSIIKYLFG